MKLAIPVFALRIIATTAFGHLPDIDSCIYAGVDNGYNLVCGDDGNPYMDSVMIIANDDGFSFPSWFSGTTEVDSDMTSAEACQEACREFTSVDGVECAYFAYEYEYQADLGYYVHECYLKSGWADDACDESDACTFYEWWNDEENQEDYASFSGPAYCSQCPNPTFP